MTSGFRVLRYLERGPSPYCTSVHSHKFEHIVFLGEPVRFIQGVLQLIWKAEKEKKSKKLLERPLAKQNGEEYSRAKSPLQSLETMLKKSSGKVGEIM